MKNNKLINIFLPYNSKRRQYASGLYRKIFNKNIINEEFDYNLWIANNEPNEKALLKQKEVKFDINPKISIIVPVYNTPEKFFEELVNCLKDQTYKNWELCLADGSPEPLKFVDKYLKSEERIKYAIIGENKGISGNTNEALKLATGDYIGLLDHDDLLPKFSLFEVVKAINENPNAEFLYSDEDRIDGEEKKRYGVFFKPDFSKYTLRSANYICHFSIFKKSLMDKLCGFKSEYDGSQDFDIVIRASELTQNIVHIPKVLYHWRVHQNSTAGNAESKPYAYEVAKNVIKDHIKRSDILVEVEDGLSYGSYELKYKYEGNSKVLLICDFRGLNLEEINLKIQTIKEKTNYKNIELVVITDNIEIKDIKTIASKENYLEQYNEIIKSSGSEYFMILDSQFLDINSNMWMDELLGIIQDKEVGIVGTKIINPSNLVEHSGIILGMNGIGDFLYKGADKDAGTYMQRLKIIHNVSCLYYKYSLIKTELFLKVNGFSSQYKGLSTSIDLSLNILQQNKNVVINPLIEIKVNKLLDVKTTNIESKNIKEKWKKNYIIGDRFFSPNLSKRETGLRIETIKLK